MIQLYPLSLLVIVFSALLSFVEVYRTELSFLLRFKIALRRNERLRTALSLVVLILSLLMLLFPLYPGPMILGDLLPSITMIYASLFIRRIDDSVADMDVDGRKEGSVHFKRGVFFSLVFLLHFLFPSFIIL